MKKLLVYLKGYEKETVLAPLFKMLEALFELFVPLVMAAVIDVGIGGHEMAIGMVNQKTTAVRLIPVIGKDVGETAEFGGLLGYAPIIPVNEYDCSAFVNRKGRIPAPVHSFKN